MKKFVVSAAVLLAALVCSAETVPASDSRISYIGRTEILSDGSVRFDWSATTLRVRFKGKSLTMRCSDTRKDYFNVWVDKAQGPQHDFVFTVSSDTTITLFSGKKGVHDIIIQKRTEAEQGAMTVISLSSDGEILQARAPKANLIEFVGDSYTCGYGTEGKDRNEPFLASTENPALTYADILARYFDCEAVHISHSGRGVVRNYDDHNRHENMVKLYGQTYDQFDEQAWTPTYKPCLVVVYLGTNDFSCGKQPSLGSWCNGYKALLLKIRELHGEDVPILCLASKADEMMESYVVEAVKRSELHNVHYVALHPDAFNYNEDLGSSWHPKYSGNIKISSIVAPYIATIMDWKMPFKPYE